MGLLRRTGFRQQLSFTVTTGVLLIALFSSLASSWQGSRQIRQTLMEQGERIADTLAGRSALALLYASSDNATEAVNATLAFPDVTKVEIRDPDGRPLLVRGKVPVDTPDEPFPASAPRQAHLEAETDDTWRFVAPVLTRGADSPFEVTERREEILGYVRVVQSKATLSRMIANVFLINLAISFFFAAAFLLAIRYLAGRLTHPLTALSAAMARAERGEANVRAEVAGPRDIGEMAQTFNRMIAVLQEREQALRESQARYREVVESVKEVIFQTDAAGRWTLLNPAWSEITGFDLDETLGQSMADYVAAEDRPVFARWQERLETGETTVCRYEVRFRRRDGKTEWIEVTQRARRGEDGAFAGTSGTLDDITERKAAVQKLQDMNIDLENRVRERTGELEASNRELEAFSYSVSHDLRAPLRGIDGFAHILEEEYVAHLDEAGRGYLGRIRAATKRMAHLIDDLLELGRITRANLASRSVDLSAVAHNIVRDLREADPERQADIAIGENLTALADPTLVQVVLDNLLRNAWKFTGQRERARISFDATTEGNEKVFFVRDNGAGFDMRYSGQLFRPFQRLHPAAKFSGTGIGLATVHRIIQRHGGRVWAESEPERGATFYFTLPGSQQA